LNETYKLDLVEIIQEAWLKEDQDSLIVLLTYHEFEEVHLKLGLGALTSIRCFFNVRSEDACLCELHDPVNFG